MQLLRTVLGAALVLAAAVVSGCSSIGARAHNLEALHTDDGFHRLEAVLYGAFEWEFRQGVRGLLPESSIAVQEKEPSRVDDPCEVCLENLVELQGAEPPDEYQASVKVQQFARWAVECPWALSRERSLLALADEAERLHLSEHLPRPQVETSVGPEELGDALAQLVAAARPSLTGEMALDLGKIGEACDRLRGLDYDLDGARRALAMVSLLVARAPQSRAELEPLTELHVELERLTVQRALSAGLIDSSPFERTGTHPGWGSARVRATAVRACVRGMGPSVLAELLARQLGPGQDSEVLLALADEVRRLGHLPVEEGGLPKQDQALWRERWMDSLVGLATSHYDGQVRVAAMRALAVLSGGELASLREEDWLAWRKEHAPPRAGPPAGRSSGSGSGPGGAGQR